MYILGIHNCYDSGAAIFGNGECLFAVNEERLSRKKMDDAYPQRSIDACLEFAKITIDEVDVISYGWHDRFPYEEHLVDYVTRAIEIASEGEDAKRIMLERIRIEVDRSVPRKKLFDDKMKEAGVFHKVEYFDHHKAHAAAAFYPSPFSEALVVTLDASGNFRSGSVSVGKDAGLTEISTNYTWDSLGFLYGQITELLGFVPHKHEGKVTGLAAHGDPKKCIHVMQEMISFENGKIRARLGKYYKPFFYQQTQALKDALAPFSREDIAAALQQHTEDVVTRYIKHYVDVTKLTRIACAGGLFANVKLNQRIRAIKGVTDLFVFPHMGDGGLSYGAALMSAQKRGMPRRPIVGAYLGGESRAQDVDAVSKEFGAAVRVTEHTHDALVNEVVALLRKGTVIGLFQGRMEFGPRALGNRTVLFHAADATVNDWLNKRLRRTEFMPFAPVTTEELAPRCFVGWDQSHVTTRFMTECYDCTPEMKANSPAVVHVDGTARPQIISREDNPFYYDLVTAWHKETGGLCLINTSFNEHEEPIVCGIHDAVESMLNGNVDFVVVNGKQVFAKA